MITLRWEPVPYGRGSVEKFADVSGVGRYLIKRSHRDSRELAVWLNGKPTAYRGTIAECEAAVQRAVNQAQCGT